MDHSIEASELDRIVGEIRSRGWAVSDALFPIQLCQQLRDDVRHLQQRELLVPAKVGLNDRRRLNTVRSDQIYWLELASLTAPQRDYLGYSQRLMQELGRGLCLALNAFEAHYACYASGGRYVKHLDRFKQDDSRVLSCVLFLNDNWSAHDGGELCIYDEQDPKRIATEVLPELGRCALFLSGSVFHEVCRTERERLSLTAWMKNVTLLNDPLAFGF